MRVAFFLLLVFYSTTVFSQKDKVAGDKVNGDKVMGNKVTIYQTKESSNILSLQIIDRTIKIRELLSTESKQTTDTIVNNTDGTRKVISIWTEPNNFAIQQVISIADIDAVKVIESLLPLLSDKNVTVSSGAVISLTKIISNTKNFKKKKALISLIPKVQNRNFTTNLAGASMQNHDFTSLKGTDIFYGSNLTGADFSNCKLDSLNFKLANAEYVKFTQSSLSNAIFERANLRNAKFWGVSALRASFRLATLFFTDFSNHKTIDKPSGLSFQTSTQFIPANLESADFGDGALYRTNFSGARLGLAKFNGASLSEVNFKNSFLLGMAMGVTEEYIQSLKPSILDNCIF